MEPDPPRLIAGMCPDTRRIVQSRARSADLRFRVPRYAAYRGAILTTGGMR
jgi:hypothetical protein